MSWVRHARGVSPFDQEAFGTVGKPKNRRRERQFVAERRAGGRIEGVRGTPVEKTREIRDERATPKRFGAAIAELLPRA